MSLSKNKLIPNEQLNYERVDQTVFARYASRPDIPRWIIGGDPKDVAKKQGKLFDYADWQDMMEEADNNPVLKKYLQKAVEAFYLTKEKQ